MHRKSNSVEDCHGETIEVGHYTDSGNIFIRVSWNMVSLGQEEADQLISFLQAARETTFGKKETS